MRGRITHDTNPDRKARKDYWGVVPDSPTPGALARFYATLLEREIASEEETRVTIRPRRASPTSASTSTPGTRSASTRDP
jgi:hypothetical protein